MPLSPPARLVASYFSTTFAVDTVVPTIVPRNPNRAFLQIRKISGLGILSGQFDQAPTPADRFIVTGTDMIEFKCPAPYNQVWFLSDTPTTFISVTEGTF